MLGKAFLINGSQINFKKNVEYLTLTRLKSFYKGKKDKNLDKVIYEDKNVPVSDEFEEGEFLPRRLSYVPEGLPQNRGKKLKPWLPDFSPVGHKFKDYKEKSEFSETPEYPSIIEMSKGYLRNKSEYREKRISFYKSIDKLPTFDQKLYELINVRPMNSVLLKNIHNVYYYLPLFQYMTKTNLIENELPSEYNEIDDEKLSYLVNKIKPHVLNVIKNSIEIEVCRPFNEFPISLKKAEYIPEIKKTENLIQNINNICMKLLTSENELSHLDECNVDIEADIRSWWWGNVFKPSKNIKAFQVENVEKINLSCLYTDYSSINIRIKEPLVPILDHDLIKEPVSKFPTHPFKLGFAERTRFGSTIPGFLPPLDQKREEINDFPFLTYLNQQILHVRNLETKFNFNDNEDVLMSMAIINNFAYLNSLAAVHGFTIYNELTYPFKNQSVITDGKNWSFFVYQLNAHAFHTDLKNSEKQNLCWSKLNLKLYENYSNGTFEGVNDEVLKLLIKFYLQKPKLTEVYNELRPLLGEDTRPDSEKQLLREDLRRRLSHHKKAIEKIMMIKKTVFPYEWLLIRNPKSANKFIRTHQKWHDSWPKDKLSSIVYE